MSGGTICDFDLGSQAIVAHGLLGGVPIVVLLVGGWKRLASGLPENQDSLTGGHNENCVQSRTEVHDSFWPRNLRQTPI